jgi:hypothetical protein
LILKIIFFIKKYYLNTFPNIKYLEKQLLSNSQTPHKTTNKYELASGHDLIFFLLIVGVRTSLHALRLIFRDHKVNDYISPSDYEVCDAQSSDF